MKNEDMIKEIFEMTKEIREVLKHYDLVPKVQTPKNANKFSKAEARKEAILNIMKDGAIHHFLQIAEKINEPDPVFVSTFMNKMSKAGTLQKLALGTYRIAKVNEENNDAA